MCRRGEPSKTYLGDKRNVARSLKSYGIAAAFSPVMASIRGCTVG